MNDTDAIAKQLDEPTAHDLRPLPRLADDAHKGDAGRVLCVVGSETMPGAAILVARAAARAGAGLVAIGCLDDHPFHAVPIAAPEAVLIDLRRIFATTGPDGGELDPRDVERDAALALAERVPHARLAGPGLGEGERTRRVVELLLAAPGSVPLLLDADALNVLGPDPERLAACEGAVVITPHPGEAARLLGRAIPAEEAGRVEGALELARRGNCVVCLKGRGTVIADGEHALVNRSGNCGMATGGSGDVLAGILVAYLAQVGRAQRGRGAPFTPFDAAALAVHLHGLAGDLAAARFGRRAVIASDLVEHLGDVQAAFDERE